MIITRTGKSGEVQISCDVLGLRQQMQGIYAKESCGGTSLKVSRFKRMNSQSRSEESRFGEFIHRQNLLLFKKRLTEAHDPTMHEMLLKLLADEEAKDEQLPSKLSGEQ